MTKKRHITNLTRKNVLTVVGARIPPTVRRPDLYYYGIRHGDNWEPATVERFVYVNFWGTVITAKPLNIDDGTEANTMLPDFIDLNTKQRALLYEKSDRKEDL